MSHRCKDINIKYKAINLLEDKKGENLDNLVFNNAFLDITTKAKSRK